VTQTDDSVGLVVFVFEPIDSTHETLIIRLEPTAAVSGTDVSDHLSRVLDPSETREISLVVGARAAVLFVDGGIEAAVRLQGPVTVQMEVRDGPIGIERSARIPAATAAGC